MQPLGVARPQWVKYMANQYIFNIFQATLFSTLNTIMMTSSNGNIFRVTGPLWGEYTGHQRIPLTKKQWRGALMFSLIRAWTKDWANNRKADDLRWHHANDVTIMIDPILAPYGLKCVIFLNALLVCKGGHLPTWFCNLSITNRNDSTFCLWAREGYKPVMPR